MGSVGNPETWPYGNNIRDCSQGICSIYYPKWCLPPPRPSSFPLQTSDPSDPNVSPLIIAIIGILAAAFLLVTYYLVASKYCATSGTSPSRRPADSRQPDRDGDAGGGGVEESLIKSMMVCRYRKGKGVMGITDCPVCLNEFQQDESLGLLPKCCYAFPFVDLLLVSAVYKSGLLESRSVENDDFWWEQPRTSFLQAAWMDCRR